MRRKYLPIRRLYEDGVNWLNYHHLLYFRTAAKLGSISSAAKELHLSRPTVTSQIRSLERSVGGKLFEQEGRRLHLTHLGQTVLRYADDLFSTGEELQRVLRGGREESLKLVVGIPDVMPKLVAFRILEPVLSLGEPCRIVCREGHTGDLLAELALHRLDLVLSDSPIDPSLNIRAYNHKLGECDISFFAIRALARRLRPGFPGSLQGARVLLPTEAAGLRRSINRWLEDLGVRPTIVGEFDDSALLKVFGQAGQGAFPAPSIIASQICEQYGVEEIGRTSTLRERYFAISVERKIKHAAVLAITSSARTTLFEPETTHPRAASP